MDAMFVVMHLLNAHRVVLCHFAQVLAAEFGVEHETSQKLRTTDTPSSLSHLTIILPRDEGLPVAQHLECCNKLYLRCTGHPSTAVNSLDPKAVIGRQALDDMFCLGSGYAKKAFELIVVEPGSGAEVVVVYAFTCSLAIVFHALPLGWPLIASIAPPFAFVSSHALHFLLHHRLDDAARAENSLRDIVFFEQEYCNYDGIGVCLAVADDGT